MILLNCLPDSSVLEEIGFLLVWPKFHKIYFLFVNLVIFYSLIYITHELDSSKIFLFFNLIFLFDFSQFLQFGLHLYDLLFSISNLVSDWISLLGTCALFNGRK
jgi:hypothetical protein